MDQDTMKHMDAELAHAGEETTLSPLMLKLEQLRITPDRELPPMDFLFRLFDKPCFPRHELVGITGKAKSGKTFLTSMLIACCQAGDVLALHRCRAQPLRVLWYDTEQSDESTQDILKNRILPLIRPKTTDSTENTTTNSTNETTRGIFRVIRAIRCRKIILLSSRVFRVIRAIRCRKITSTCSTCVPWSGSCVVRCWRRLYGGATLTWPLSTAYATW